MTPHVKGNSEKEDDIFIRYIGRLGILRNIWQRGMFLCQFFVMAIDLGSKLDVFSTFFPVRTYFLNYHVAQVKLVNRLRNIL